MKARIIAFYLPQFHPIPENDKWWGKGFTEWTSVAKAKPLFKGHYQPKIPKDLGFYDLRLPIIREQQAQMARDAGIEGFCYWHYWFGNGKRLLEKPFQEMLESRNPDFSFCLGWANHDWEKKEWNSETSVFSKQLLMKQTYPGEEDYITHFEHLLSAFKDRRYITVDAKPLFYIFDPYSIPEIKGFIELWRNLAKNNGLQGIHFVALCSNFSFRKKIEGQKRMTNIESIDEYYQYVLDLGFDAIHSSGSYRAQIKIKGKFRQFVKVALERVLKISFTSKYKQKDINRHLYVEAEKRENIYPQIIPCWDRSPRVGKKADIYTGSTPEEFKQQIRTCLELVKDKSDEHKIIFLKSWNEWGEGNYVEPCLKYGHGYLNAIRDCVLEK
jgi:hypothetical protein